MPPAKAQGSETLEEDLRPVHEFWNGFINGEITPWRHKDYLQMVYMTLLLPENKNSGLLEVASDFAAKMDSSRQRTSRLQHQPESRTKTVFWLYQVKQGVDSAEKVCREPDHFTPPFILVLEMRPELLNPRLLDQYYTMYLQNEYYFQRYYVLPDIKALQPPSEAPKSLFGFGNKTAPEPFEHERYFNMAFAIVQRYLREGETRRRSWFIERGFEALRQEFIRMRAFKNTDGRGRFISNYDSGLQPFSETKAYFYVQLVHVALSKFTTGGHHDTVQRMTYRTFKLFFSVEPDIWKKHYSVKLWTSPKALGRFQPPDLKPLPDTIVGSFKIENSFLVTALGVSPPSDSAITPSDLLNPTAMNEAFCKMGLEPELPLREIIAFHHAILIEDAKSIDTTTGPVSPSHLPTPAHLFKYIYTTLLTAGSMVTLPTRASRLLSTLFHHASPNIPRPHLLFYLNYLLNFCTPGIELAYPGILPPTRLRNSDCIDDGPHWREKIQFRPITTATRINPETKQKETVHTRYHNCPCHNGDPLPYDIGPSACEYPIDFPYEHPPQLYHGCDCHNKEKIDQDKLAEIVAGMYAEQEDGEKIQAGLYRGTIMHNNRKRKVGDETFLEWLRRWPELALVEFVGEEDRGLLKLWERREGVIQLLREEDGNVPVTGMQVGEEEEEDGKTLAGDREMMDEEEDWEVLSEAGTLCER